MDLLKTFPGLRYSPHRPTDTQAMFLVGSVLRGEEPETIELMFGGAAGGGKSDAMLMAALMFVDVPGYSAIIFRKTIADLRLPGAILSRSREWLTSSDAKWNDDQKVWTFPSGATIAFGYLEHSGDEYRYQGAEFQTVCFDELTQFEEQPYLYLFSRVRRLEGSPLPARMMSATNPGGVGHGWVSKRFIDEPTEHRLFIPSKLADNPHLDRAQYAASLMHLPELFRRQLLDGDWAATEGLAFPEWLDHVHLVDQFPIPPEWERFECMDHGTANPTVFHLIAVDYDGNLIAGDTYFSPGMISDHCAEVLRRRGSWYPRWRDSLGGEHQGDPSTIADPSVTSRTGTLTRWGQPATIASEYLEQSSGRIALLPGNNDPKAGRARISELLKPDPERLFPEWHPRKGEKGSPRMFVTSACKELANGLKVAPLLPIGAPRIGAGEIVDPKWEGPHGHAVAALRYGVMSRPEASTREERHAQSEQELRKRAARHMRDKFDNPQTRDI